MVTQQKILTYRQWLWKGEQVTQAGQTISGHCQHRELSCEPWSKCNLLFNHIFLLLSTFGMPILIVGVSTRETFAILRYIES